MKYIGIDQARFEPVREKRCVVANKFRKCRNYLIVAIIVLLFAITMAKVYVQPGKSTAIFTMMMVLAIFSGTVAVALMFLTKTNYHQLQQLERREKQALRLEINDDEIIYQDKRISSQIDFVQLDSDYLIVGSKNQQLRIDTYINGGEELINIFNFLYNCTQARIFDNPLFKELLRVKNASQSFIHQELKTMKFILPINYTFAHFNHNEDCTTLAGGITINYETQMIENRGKYLCVYSCKQELSNQQFKDAMVMSYEELFSLIVGTGGEIFSKEVIAGMVINCQSDNLILTFNKIVAKDS